MVAWKEDNFSFTVLKRAKPVQLGSIVYLEVGKYVVIAQGADNMGVPTQSSQ